MDKDFLRKSFEELKANTQIAIKNNIYMIVAFVNDKRAQENDSQYYLLLCLDKTKRPSLLYLTFDYFVENYKEIELC